MLSAINNLIHVQKYPKILIQHCMYTSIRFRLRIKCTNGTTFQDEESINQVDLISNFDIISSQIAKVDIADTVECSKMCYLSRAIKWTVR